MAACEYCWSLSVPGEYGQTIRRAEEEGWPCTKNDEEGARLRAGQFWDEASKSDRRNGTQFGTQSSISTTTAPESAAEVTSR